MGDHGDDLFVRVKRWSCLPVKIVVCILVVDYALYERHGILLVLFLLLVFWAVLAELVFVAASGLLLLTVDRPQHVLVNILSRGSRHDVGVQGECCAAEQEYESIL